MRRALRFLWITFVAAIGVTFLGHLFIPAFEPSYPTDPYERNEIILGICVWVIVLIIPTIDLLRANRRRARETRTLV